MVKPLELELASNPPELRANAQAFADALKHSLNVKAAFEYVRTKSTSNAAPYHNLYHIQCVTSLSHLGALSCDLGRADTEELLIAALFHDFNHSQGVNEDEYNINQALSGFYLFAKERRLDDQAATAVSELIKCTQFPFVREPSNLAQQILRDADMMQITCPQWKEMIFDGLMQEVSITKKPENLSMAQYQIDFARKAKNFYLDAEFYSPWGERLKAYFIDTVNARFDEQMKKSDA